MTHSDNAPDYEERARMHDRLAATTNGPAARQVHQAMAAEFRRRAGQSRLEDGSKPPEPVLEIYPRAS